jgi:hypothetical protein
MAGGESKDRENAKGNIRAERERVERRGSAEGRITAE